MDTQDLINLYCYYRDMQEDAYNNYDEVSYKMYFTLANHVENLIEWDSIQEGVKANGRFKSTRSFQIF